MYDGTALMVSTMEKRQVIVVGGGVAGCTAALEAARLGLNVALVDEHPQTLATMSLDTPYFYGSGLPNILSNRSLMAESVFGANDLLMQCVEEGVDVHTSTCVWGSYRPCENNSQIHSGQLGLADENRSWMLEYDYLILAPGARDFVLSFANWQLPGVFGSCGGSALLDRYKAFEGQNLFILGSGNWGLRMAKSALEAGVTVLGIVDVASQIQGDTQLATELQLAGVKFYLSHTIIRANGKLKVEGIRLVRINESLAPIADTEIDYACDTICMAYSAVPNIELSASSNCKISFNAELGGWIPEVDQDMRTSENEVFVVGDGAFVTEAMVLDPTIATRAAKRVVEAIAKEQGLNVPSPTECVTAGSSLYPPTAWHQSLLNSGGLDVLVCQCEEVTRREILDLTPPKYLLPFDRKPNGGLAGLSISGRTSQDLVKRLTRVGMGHCQGKRCRDQTALLLADNASGQLAAITPGSYRVPLRPLPLNVLWPEDESEQTRKEWRTWIHAADGIPEV
jgi:NADPH-dependent 2,4-dienoyl-CoA reductase/sulfur reductase-like enzyme